MVISNEPGYYQAGAFGIRHENLLLVRPSCETEYGAFLRFENLTMVPFDRDAIDPALPLGLGEVPYGPLQVMHLQADASALQEDTGWRPATPFEEGIRETIEWVRKETK